MLDEIYIVIFLLFMLALFAARWILGWEGPIVNTILFVLVALFIGFIFVAQGIYWALIPLVLGLAAIGFYLYETTFKRKE